LQFIVAPHKLCKARMPVLNLHPNGWLIVPQVRKAIGPIATPDVIHWAPALPKTRSGKIMRRGELLRCAVHSTLQCCAVLCCEPALPAKDALWMDQSTRCGEVLCVVLRCHALFVCLALSITFPRSATQDCLTLFPYCFELLAVLRKIASGHETELGDISTLADPGVVKVGAV